jgi:hypothetical protein
MILQNIKRGDGATSKEVLMEVMTLDVLTHEQAHQQAPRAEQEAQQVQAQREELLKRISALDLAAHPTTSSA